MATIKLQFRPWGFVPAASNGPQFRMVGGTNFPVESLCFDASTNETCYVFFRATDYASGNLTLTLNWYADTGSSGTVIWGAQIAAITPDTDTQDIETKSFATANTVTDTHLGTTNQRVHTCAITISNLDSIAADDYVALALYRDTSDTMTGDASLIMAELSYTGT